MQTGSFIVMAFLVGAIAAIYLPMNASVARHLGSPLTANITFYSVALVTSILLFAWFGDRGTLTRIGAVPAWPFLTGVISAFIVMAITFLIPKIGARQLSILSIGGQLIMAMIVSHLGILEAPKDPITLNKIAGACLLFCGAAVSIS